MRILELGKFYAPHAGGIETLLKSWCEGFVGFGAEVNCVVANDRPRTVHETHEGVRVHRYASWGTVASTSVCPGYVGAARRFGGDVWHAHFPNPLADAACLRAPRSSPLVVSYHSDIIRQSGLMRLYGPVVKGVLRRAARVVVAAPQHLEYSPWLREIAGKCEVIPFGIRLERFAPSEGLLARAQEWRRRGAGRPIVLTVGRLVGYKGHRFLIEAAARLDAVVWIAGTGPLEKELKRLMRQFELESRVQFLGRVTDEELPALLTACDVFVLPSISPNEAFGIVQVEAMACGKPVVSCALRSGVPFVNRDGETGLLVPPGDSAALAEAIRKLLDKPMVARRMGAAGRRRALEDFAEPLMVKRYWNLFEELLAERRGCEPTLQC